MTVSSSESEYTRLMRSPTVGGYAIANHLHLLTLGRQVIVRLQMLQPNSVLAIPHSHAATKVIHCADNCPTATFASQFRFVLGKDLTDFPNLVTAGYLGAFHNLLHPY
ncbi:hypothetical protein H6G97_37845 [Nostoc flagelliforme FACHB-838]|uniref:Uncharacterized protein n=1 Tax=Nostoc flagelliforme FACHB-838 TaxID=2692904 RepID=A0ABR8DZN6_9NOSO|nr:hypothetical protein [Nostoc flagelliforme]MBD2534894.1 hypothetical protein [Nostoc flagelliforme FACHB-838]